MLSTQIKLLEKFGTCTVIMPYFGHVDRSFLLLTCLNKNIRRMLDENYDALMNCMMETAVCLKIKKDHQKDLLFHPCDLFIFSIEIGDKEHELVDTFCRLIMNINDLKGHYFNEHFMHKRLSINRFIIDETMLSKLHSSLDLLKMSKVFIKEKNSILQKPILDIFSVSRTKTNLIHKPLYTYIINWVDKIISDPVFESFRRFQNINLKCIATNIDIKDKNICTFKYLQLKANEYELEPISLEDAEIVTDPELFSNGVDFIQYWMSNKYYKISSQIITNINALRPKVFRYLNYYDHTEISNFIKLFSNIEDCSKFEWIRYSCLRSNFSFTNLPILFKTKEQDLIFITLKRFTCFLDIDELNFKLYFSKSSTKEDTKDNTFLHLTNSAQYVFEDYKIILEEDKISQMKEEFSEYLSNFDDIFEFIIPMRCLDYVNFNIPDIVNSCQGKAFIDEIYNSPRLSCALIYPKDLLKIDEYISLFPPNCLYSIIDYQHIECKYLGLPNKITDTIKKIRISDIKLHWPLAEDHFQLIKEIVFSSYSKTYLKAIELTLLTLDEAIELLYLLSDCMNLDSVILRIDGDTMFNEFETEAIREAKNEFYMKVGIISELSIY